MAAPPFPYLPAPRSGHELCPCVALYGLVVTGETLRLLLHTTLAWCRERGLRPDYVSIARPGPGRTKWKSFPRLQKRLLIEDFETAESLALQVLAPGEPSILDGDWLVHVRMSKGFRPVFYLTTSPDVAAVGDPALLDFVHTIAAATAPAYGLGVSRLRGHSPSSFATGWCYGWGRDAVPPLPEVADTVELDQWQRVGETEAVFRYGVLRGVYPWNFLTAAQLDVDWGTGTLREWILGEAGRGVLRPFTDTLWLWEVPAGAIPATETALASQGRILHALLPAYPDYRHIAALMEHLRSRVPEP